MSRGGFREGAGRKTGWSSGCKFEETSPIRVPNYIKSEVLEIAHKLDAGEKIDFVSNSKREAFQELEAKLSVIELEKQEILKQMEEYQFELETKSKEFELKIQKLEEENSYLQGLLTNNQSTSSTRSTLFVDLLTQSIEKWRKQIQCLRPIDLASRIPKILSELQTMVSDEISRFDIVPNSNNNLSSTSKEIVTNSKRDGAKIVTKSINHTQLEFIDFDTNHIVQGLQPLNATELSKRFNKSEGFVTSKKSQFKDNLNEFSSFLKRYDPQGIEWVYSETDKKYHPKY